MALPGALRAQDFNPLTEIFGNGRVLREADQTLNTDAAQSLIATNEPILSYDTVYNLQLAISQYEPFVANGGWEEIPQEAYQLTLGNSSSAVIALKRRLIGGGDMPFAENINDTFDAQTDAGVRIFQARHGLIINGKIDEPTWYAMNVPAQQRLQQLYLNYTRVQTMAANLNPRYVVVNIPAATIEAVNDGMVEQRHTAVVGRVERATPIMASKISQINFNPYWHVPKSLVRQDLTKYMQENPNYLTEQNIFIYDGAGNKVDPATIVWSSITDEQVNYMYRQEPGAANSMGHCKINFYNPYDCYLHDTPSKSLFARDFRAYSHGCVRVQNPMEFADALMANEPNISRASLEAMFGANEKWVNPEHQIPVHIAYFTIRVEADGSLRSFGDVYGHNAKLIAAMGLGAPDPIPEIVAEAVPAAANALSP